MASQATITSKVGPAITVTAEVLTGVKQFNLDLEKGMLYVEHDAGRSEFDIEATTTLTCTITAGANATIVVSQ